MGTITVDSFLSDLTTRSFLPPSRLLLRLGFFSAALRVYGGGEENQAYLATMTPKWGLGLRYSE